MILLISLALADDLESYKAENEALREAISASRKQVSELEAALADSKAALDKKDEVISLRESEIAGYQSLIVIKDRVISTLEQQAEIADQTVGSLQKSLEQERKSKNVGKFERILWGSSLVAVAVGTAYVVKSTSAPVIVNTTGAANERRCNSYLGDCTYRFGGSRSIPLVYQRW